MCSKKDFEEYKKETMKGFEHLLQEEVDEHLLEEIKKMISKAKRGQKIIEANWVEFHARPAPSILIETVTKDYHEKKAGLAEQIVKLEELKQQKKQRKEARNKAKEEGKK
jgi:hypothetical protein